MVQPDIRVIGAGAMIAPFLFCALWLASALTDGQWTFGQQTLSTLGISENTVAASLFNCACVISGILGILFCIFRYDYENRYNRFGSIALGIGMFMLALVGVFTKAPETYTIHVIIATLFGVLMILAMILSIRGDRDYRWLQIVTVILLIFCVIIVITQEKAMWEALTIIAGIAWIFFQGVKYILYRNDYALKEV